MAIKAKIKNSSIRVRLSILTVLNCGFALLLAGIALFAYESYEKRQAAQHDLSTQAGILAESTSGPLSSSDAYAVSRTLAALRRDPTVVEASIYDRNNIPFSRYVRDGVRSSSVPPWPRPTGSYLEGDALEVFAPISSGGHRIGTIFLKATNHVFAGAGRYIAIVCLVKLLSLLVTLLLGSATQRSIANPITALSDLSRRVSVDKDYSVRAERGTGGEIGILIESFNDMLSQIEAREKARRSAEESLFESEERYALAARGANDGLWDWKLTTNEIYLSPRWYQMLGYSDSEHWEDPEEWFSRIHPADRRAVMAEIIALREGEERELTVEYRMRHKSGAFIWVLTRGIGIRDENGAAIRMAGSQTDITEGKIADPLTTLPNRLYFIDRLESALEIANTGAFFAVMFLDLDKFKVVNDSLGHAAGDQLLVGVAERLSSVIRSSERNSVGKHSVVARLSGDEFAILLNEINGDVDPANVARQILDKLKMPFTIEGRQVFASASIGIALNSSGNTPGDLMRNADTAMYQAKAGGKARFAVFDERMRERAVARLETETDLRKGIETNQLVVYYQPEVSLQDQQIIGYEALVRWNHPERGLLGPDAFIPIAEESDLIIHLGRWVLKEACHQMALWHLRFPSDQLPTISVNVSPKQLNDPQLVDDVQSVLALTGLNPETLKLEMTESSFMANPGATLGTLTRLKLLKIGLEIDDFGTGYSSLSCLHLLPFDTVKIDRSFIGELGAGTEGTEIVHTIVELAKSLEMKVVAEGVEIPDQIQTLTDLGCDYAQGYYFSKPKSAAPTEELMKERYNLRRAFCVLQGLEPVSPQPSEELSSSEPSSTEPALV